MTNIIFYPKCLKGWLLTLRSPLREIGDTSVRDSAKRMSPEISSSFEKSKSNDKDNGEDTSSFRTLSKNQAKNTSGKEHTSKEAQPAKKRNFMVDLRQNSTHR